MTLRLLIAMVLLTALMLQPAFAQDAADADAKKPKFGWKNNLVGNFGFSQTAFDNWQQGGENAWNWQFDVLGNFTNNRPKTIWENLFKTSYGRSKIGDDESKKSADQIRIESSLAYKMKLHVNPYIRVTGETQYTSGFDFKQDPKVEVSKFMNPGYFTQSAGLGYQPVEEFRTRFGVSLKQTVTTDDEFALRYTDQNPTDGKIDRIRSEIGAEWLNDYAKEFNENTAFISRLEFFSNLKAINQVDVRWDNLLTTKVTKFIAFTFAFELYYDRDISIKRQLKEVLSIGLTYAFLEPPAPKK